MPAPLHICHVITRLIVGGAQENTILSCEGLHARGHRVTLVSGLTEGAEGSLTARARQGGYAFLEVPELVRAVQPLTDLRCRRALRHLFRALAPDVVHTHSSKAGILGRMAAREAGVPVIVHTVHGMSFNRTQAWPVQRLYRALERGCARYTDAIACVAHAMVRQMIEAGVCEPGKLLTIYSGMEVDRFDPATYDRAALRRAWGVTDDQIVIGTVARLFRRKGYEQLIPIMAKLAQQMPQLRFVWVGDGAQRQEYEGRLAALGLRDRTTLTGLVPPERVPELMSGFDILAHTSQWEGLPRVVVQALLMQVPAVAFDIDGTREVVLDGVTGRLLRLNDERGFVRGVVELANDERLRTRLGSAGRAHCLERFDWRLMVKRLEELYQAFHRTARARQGLGSQSGLPGA